MLKPYQVFEILKPHIKWIIVGRGSLSGYHTKPDRDFNSAISLRYLNVDTEGFAPGDLLERRDLSENEFDVYQYFADGRIEKVWEYSKPGVEVSPRVYQWDYCTERGTEP